MAFPSRVIRQADKAMGKCDLLARAAECERALQVATEQRDLLQQVRDVWLGLAREQRMARDPKMQKAIADLKRLHAEITAAGPTLH